MRLYILRHAEAEDRRAGLRDADRPLTARGAAQASDAADFLRAGRKFADVPIARIVSSRAVRARTSARAVAERLHAEVEYDERIGLDAGVDDVKELVRELAAGDGACVIVGHNPTLEDLLEVFGAEPRLRKGELVALDVQIEAGGRGNADAGSKGTHGGLRASERGRFRSEAR